MDLYIRRRGQSKYIGIDVVAVRRGDERHVAIQYKSHSLENGTLAAIPKSELDSKQWPPATRRPMPNAI